MPDALTSERAIDTHEMVVIHRAFRRESQLLGELIAAVPDGDTERAAVLGRHLAWYQAGLTNHHHGEDELLWPLLHQRADVDAEIVVRMEHQHGRVADTLANVMGVLPAWQASAAADRRDELVSALSTHRRVLIEHLDDEEGHLLPLAARHLTGPEWAALGEHFVATTPKAELLDLPRSRAGRGDRRRAGRAAGRHAPGGSSRLVERRATPLRVTHAPGSREPRPRESPDVRQNLTEV